MTTATVPHTCAVRTAAFTLIEMVVSLSIISVVFLAMGSVMVLASKAVPDPKASTGMALTADLLEQIAAEVQVATSVSIATDKGIAFTVPDRDGDGTDESIVYLWGGVAGSALVRQYNGGTVVTVIPAAYEFGLYYTTRPAPQPDLLTESSEVLLSSYAPGLISSDHTITNKLWIGQLISPGGIPPDAVDWNITRVLFRAAKKSSQDGMTQVQIRTVNTDMKPSTTVLESHWLDENNLDSNYQWQSYIYSAVRGLSPTQCVCLVLQWTAGSESANISYEPLLASCMLTTTNGGGTWSESSAKGMHHYVYGTYTTPTSQPPIDVIASVTLTLNTGATGASRARISASTLNQPPMP